MGVITAANLKWYRCTSYEENDDHGGDIDLTEEITSGQANNIFDNVEDQERIDGAVDYRKVFFRNENVDSYTGTKIWIQANTPALNDKVEILQCGSAAVVGKPVNLTQTNMQFTNATTGVTGDGTSFLSELRPGDRIYNGTDDTESDAILIASVETDTALTLASNYLGTTSGTCQGYVASLDGGAFVDPYSKVHADTLIVGDLGMNESVGVCIRRTVTAGGANGYTNNSFTLRAEDS